MNLNNIRTFVYMFTYVCAYNSIRSIFLCYNNKKLNLSDIRINQVYGRTPSVLLQLWNTLKKNASHLFIVGVRRKEGQFNLYFPIPIGQLFSEQDRDNLTRISLYWRVTCILKSRRSR